MIIRLFHAKVRPGKQAEFKKTLELLSLPEIQSRKGMVAFYPGQPFGSNSNEFVLVTVWIEQPLRKTAPKKTGKRRSSRKKPFRCSKNGVCMAINLLASRNNP